MPGVEGEATPEEAEPSQGDEPTNSEARGRQRSLRDPALPRGSGCEDADADHEDDQRQVEHGSSW